MSSTTYDRFAGLHIYSQNVYKKYTWIDSLLVQHENLSDIIFIQEPPWQLIWHTASMTEKRGDPIMGMPQLPVWRCLHSKVSNPSEDRPWVAAYIHQCLWAIRWNLSFAQTSLITLMSCSWHWMVRKAQFIWSMYTLTLLALPYGYYTNMETFHPQLVIWAVILTALQIIGTWDGTVITHLMRIS